MEKEQGKIIAEMNPFNCSIEELLNSPDPLSDDAFQKILSYKEEDCLIDYKEAFDPNSDKEWLGITKDIVAFANTRGGYLIFGVRDKDFLCTGLADEIVTALTDTNMVTQKINKCISPNIAELRCKKYTADNEKTVVGIFIPESRGKTHIFVKEASLKFPGGKSIVVVRPGAIYVRRSATNSIIDPDGFEEIVKRRINHFRESVMDKIAKVVEAPTEQQVILISANEGENDTENAVRLSSDPDATPIKGVSYTVTPGTNEEVVFAMIALSKSDKFYKPTPQKIWDIYAQRTKVNLNNEQMLYMVEFSFQAEAPVFFWARNVSPKELMGVFLRALKGTQSQRIKTDVLQVAAFFGKRAFERIKNAAEINSGLFGLERFPDDPSIFFNVSHYINFKVGRHYSILKSKEKLEEELTGIAKELATSDHGIVMMRAKALAIDCYLYSLNK